MSTCPKGDQQPTLRRVGCSCRNQWRSRWRILLLHLKP